MVFQGPGVYLAINPEGFVSDSGEAVRRRLEANWYGLRQGSVVTVYYGQDPDSQPSDSALLRVEPGEGDGFAFVEDVQLPYLTSQDIGRAHLE